MSQPTLHQIHEAAQKYARQILGHVKQDGAKVAVLVVLMPLDGGDPQYASSLNREGTVDMLVRVAETIALDRMTVVLGGNA